jgi:transposase
MKMKTLDEIIKEYALYVLKNTENQREAAKILGVSDRTITNYLRKWGITIDRYAYDPTAKEKPEWH